MQWCVVTFIPQTSALRHPLALSYNTLHLHPSNEYVIINVSGSVFKTRSETLSRFPDTLLGRLHL